MLNYKCFSRVNTTCRGGGGGGSGVRIHVFESSRGCVGDIIPSVEVGVGGGGGGGRWIRVLE